VGKADKPNENNFMQRVFHLLLVAGCAFANGCAMPLVTPTPPVLSDGFLTANAFVDSNGNGQYDEADQPLAGAILSAVDAAGRSAGGRTSEDGSAFATWPGGVTYPITATMIAPSAIYTLLLPSVTGLLVTAGAESPRFLFAASPMLVSDAAYEGIVVPAELAANFYQGLTGEQASAYWTATPEDIAALEAALPPYLQTAAAERSPDLWQNVATYQRQYIGLVEADEPRIYANFFCNAPDDWQQQPVLVMDGGDCFFQVEYLPASGQFENLIINGES